MEPEELGAMLGPERKLSWPALCELAVAVDHLIQTFMDVAIAECDVRWRERMLSLDPEPGTDAWRILRSN